MNFLRYLTVVILIICVSTLHGSESHSTKSFTLNGNITDIGKWINDNPDELLKVTGNQILKRDGSRVKITRDTPKGKFTLTIDESSNKEKTKFSSKLFEAETKEIKNQESTITLSKKAGKTLVEINLKARVDRDDISAFDIKFDLDRSARRIKDMLEDKFD